MTYSLFILFMSVMFVVSYRLIYPIVANSACDGELCKCGRTAAQA